ncbi:MAG TPA: glycosyltransferase, partial [Xanthobacteraceae bacterium]|nr:glycosyltransferase [Xanthobacteraceae bacterium]
PALDPLDLLTLPAADRVWRGSHLAFARAGTEFAPDTFALFNAALNPAGGAPAPDLVVCDHDRLDGAGDVTAPSLVPGWDPDFICSLDYVQTAFVAARALVLEQRTAARPASLHDWLCRIARRARQPATGHVAEPLVHMPASTPQPILAPSMPAVLSAASVTALPALAIVIPNRNKPELLEQCVRFLEFENRFRPEVVVVDNASDEAAVRTLYRDLRARYGARIIQMDQSFNFSRMVNLGVAATSAELVLLLNNDVEITTPGLVEQMIAHAVRPEIGVVGSRLMYPDGRVQHAGMLLRPGESQDHPVRVEHVLRGAPTAAEGYLYQLRTIRNYQSVTGALQMMRRDVFDHVGGFDEVAFPVEYGDVDFCLRVRRAGWRVIALPLDGILHPESSTRGTASPPAVVAMRTAAMKIMAERWPDAIARDPYRNAWVEVGEVPEARFPWSAGAAS